MGTDLGEDQEEELPDVYYFVWKEACAEEADGHPACEDVEKPTSRWRILIQRRSSNWLWKDLGRALQNLRVLTPRRL